MIHSIGVFGFGWSAAVAVFEIWFDGVSALGAMMFLTLAIFAERDPTFPSVRFRSLGLVVGGLAAFAILGIPYWFTLGALFAVFEPGSLSSAFREPLFLRALVIVLIGNLVEEWLRDGPLDLSEGEISDITGITGITSEMTAPAVSTCLGFAAG